MNYVGKLQHGINAHIEKALKEKNNFWWGCVVGISYGKQVETIRVSENEELTTTDFQPIARIKYLSPYDDNIKSSIIKWY